MQPTCTVLREGPEGLRGEAPGQEPVGPTKNPKFPGGEIPREIQGQGKGQGPVGTRRPEGQGPPSGTPTPQTKTRGRNTGRTSAQERSKVCSGQVWCSWWCWFLIAISCWQCQADHSCQRHAGRSGYHAGSEHAREADPVHLSFLPPGTLQADEALRCVALRAGNRGMWPRNRLPTIQMCTRPGSQRRHLQAALYLLQILWNLALQPALPNRRT